MRMIDLALNDLRQVVRDRKSAFFLLIMPLTFTLLFGFAFGGFVAGEEDDPRLPVGLLDEDGSVLSAQLADLLQGSEVLRIELDSTGADELALQVARNELAGGVILPLGYGESLRAGQILPLTLIADVGGGTGFTVQREVEGAARRMAAAATTARISAGIVAKAQAAGAAGTSMEDAIAAAVAAWQSPPVAILSTQSGTGADEADTVQLPSAFAHSSPGMMVQFAIAALLTAAGVLVAERNARCLQRLLTTNMSRIQILAGHFVAMFVLILAQLLLLVLFGQLFLNLEYARAPLATLLVVVATALFAAGLGLLIGALAKSQEQVIVFSLLPMFVLAGLGGAWVPLEFTPEGFQQIARLTPLAWTMSGLQDVIVRGQGVAAVLPATGVLLAYALLLFALAAWRFRFE